MVRKVTARLEKGKHKCSNFVPLAAIVIERGTQFKLQLHTHGVRAVSGTDTTVLSSIMELCFVLTRGMASRDASYVLWASLSHTAASTREVQPDVVTERVHPRQSALQDSTSNPRLTVFL
jgi:hypothetical protein